jgi:hypothetical protein
VPLTLEAARTPVVQVRGVRTSGAYAQFHSNVVELRRVNAAIRTAVLEAERGYASSAVPQLKELAKAGIRPLGGTYITRADSRFVSASSRVVSMLIPVVWNIGGGPLIWDWIPVMLQVPSAQPVSLRDLFDDPTAALRVVRKQVRTTLTRTNRCFRLSRPYWDSGLAPTIRNYAGSAFTSRGFAVGFGMGAIAADMCGPGFAVVVPTQMLRPYLTPLGQELVAGLRAPSKA